MKTLPHVSLLAVSLLLFFGPARGQRRILLRKSWIVQAIYLADSSRLGDTSYTRFTFDKNKSYISRVPAWNSNPQDWSLDGELLTIGIVTYHIDVLTDSMLVLSSPGFRTMVMKDENRLNRDSANLHEVGKVNGEPLYEANKHITPRFKNGDLEKLVHGKLSEFSIERASTFRASFTVNKDGTVSDVHVLQGILDAYDKAVVDALSRTSKDWAPAIFDDHPVNTQMIFTLRYLDSPWK